MPSPAARRRSPGYVRAWSSPAIHGVVAKMNRQRMSADLSDAQEWLWEACISELEYRRRTTRPAWRACACQFCFDPFTGESDPLGT